MMEQQNNQEANKDVKEEAAVASAINEAEIVEETTTEPKHHNREGTALSFLKDKLTSQTGLQNNFIIS